MIYYPLLKRQKFGELSNNLEQDHDDYPTRLLHGNIRVQRTSWFKALLPQYSKK
jgi:hypothetical protein